MAGSCCSVYAWWVALESIFLALWGAVPNIAVAGVDKQRMRRLGELPSQFKKRENGDCIRVLSHSYYPVITGRGVHLKNTP